MMKLTAQETALIVVDIQDFFDTWGKRNNLMAEENCLRLLTRVRETGAVPVIVQHKTSPLKPEFVPQEGDVFIRKTVNSCFIGTDLEAILREKGVRNVIIAGLTTNHCCETTARMAGNLGFHTYFISDATATFDRRGPNGELYTAEQIHEMTLVNLHEEFATVVTTEEMLELL